MKIIPWGDSIEDWTINVSTLRDYLLHNKRKTSVYKVSELLLSRVPTRNIRFSVDSWEEQGDQVEMNEMRDFL